MAEAAAETPETEIDVEREQITLALDDIATDLGFKGGENDAGGAEGVQAEGDGATPTDGATAPTDGVAAPVAATTAVKEPPKTWRKEALGLWNKVDPRVQEEILKREEDTLRGLTEKGEQARIGEQFHKAVGAYVPILSQHGLNAFQHAANLFEIHKNLAFGTPQQKVQTFQALMQQFGITPELMAQTADAGDVHPVVRDLQTRYDTLSSSLQQMLQSQATSARAQLAGEVEAFAKAPEHPFFDDVADSIASLLQSRACSTLQQAYDTAVALNPEVRTRYAGWLSEQRAAAEKKAATERAAQARRSTAANVRSSTKARGPTAPTGSIEDTLRTVADKLYD